MIGFGQEGKIGEITLRPDIWWHDAVCDEADPVCNGHTQLMFTFCDLGRPRVLSFSERLVFGSGYCRQVALKKWPTIWHAHASRGLIMLTDIGMNICVI